MRDVGRRVEELIHTMAAVSFYDLTVVRFRDFLDCVAEIAEECAWFNELDRFVQAVSCSFYNADVVWVLRRRFAYVVCLVEIGVEASMVERNVDVENVAVL